MSHPRACDLDYPDAEIVETGVLIIGSGPVGSTYARELVLAGHKVLMVEVGSQESKIPGDHKKNAITFQKDVNLFVNVVNGDLYTLSTPVAPEVFPNIDPVSDPGNASIWNGQNPEQEAKYNLDAKATRCVGGMSAHWTCCTPEMTGVELPDCYTEDEWHHLYDKARELVKTTSTAFDHSVRQHLIKYHLNEEFPDRQPGKEGKGFYSMPLACERRKEAKQFVTWSSSATVLDPIIHPWNPNFTLKEEHICRCLVRNPRPEGGSSIQWAIVKNLMTGKYIKIVADRYVVCAGAVLTPQILYNSRFDDSHPALGRYLTEQVMTFCQIILKNDLIKQIREQESDPTWLPEHLRNEILRHAKKYPEDKLPIPFKDPDPQVTTAVTKEKPWHTQIHRDAFSYGLVPDIYDQRTIVDLRWFGYVETRQRNRVTFTDKNHDIYNMPQPTFHFELGEDDKRRANAQMNDMLRVAGALGGFLPGAGPQFLTPGSALHICGTTRVGESIEDSVVDKHSRVHNTDNLFIGGCSVIPTPNAVNPTLTAIAFALVGAKAIAKDLEETTKN